MLLIVKKHKVFNMPETEHYEQDVEKDEDFEIIPISPLRKMEKRVERIEEHVVTHKDLKEMFNVVKANQEVVEEIVKLNRDMISKVSDLSSSVASIANRVSEFLARIDVEELPEAKEIRGVKDLNERINKMENRLNALILALSPKVKRPVRPAPRSFAGMQRPIARPIA